MKGKPASLISIVKIFSLTCLISFRSSLFNWFFEFTQRLCSLADAADLKSAKYIPFYCCDPSCRGCKKWDFLQLPLILSKAISFRLSNQPNSNSTIPNRTQPHQTKLIHTKPNSTKPNYSKPNQTVPNQFWLTQTGLVCIAEPYPAFASYLLFCSLLSFYRIGTDGQTFVSPGIAERSSAIQLSYPKIPYPALPTSAGVLTWEVSWDGSHN